MPGWADILKDRYEEVLDESTGEMIMVDKNAPKYKLDAQGNIIGGGPPAAAEAPAPAPGGTGFGALFGGAPVAPSGGGFVAPPSTGGGFQFGGAAAPAPGGGGFQFGGTAAPAPAGGGFQFGGGSAPAGGGFVAAPAAAGGGGFTFGSAAPAAPVPAGGFQFGGAPPAAAAPGGGAAKRKADAASAPAKRLRMRELRLTGSESGGVLIVGNGDCGQLGTGDDDDAVRDSLKFVRLPSLDAQRVCQLTCGGLHTGALTLDGRIWTWGCNDDEVLGRVGDEDQPGVVQGALVGKRVVSMCAGDSHMACLTSEGQVFSWGTYKDSNGYIGYSPEAGANKPPGEGYPGQIPWKAPTPTLVPKLPAVKALASGADHTLAVSSDGYELWAWGCGEKGQLGRELEWTKKTKHQYLVPTQPVTLRLPDSEGSKSARERHTRVMNDNFLAHLRATLKEDPAADAPVLEACEAYLDLQADLGKAGAPLDDRIKLKAVFAGAYHSFALTEHGNVYSFGLNNMGQLGLGTRDATGEPSPNSTGTPMLVEALEGEVGSLLSPPLPSSLLLPLTSLPFPPLLRELFSSRAASTTPSPSPRRGRPTPSDAATTTSSASATAPTRRSRRAPSPPSSASPCARSAPRPTRTSRSHGRATSTRGGLARWASSPTARAPTRRSLRSSSRARRAPRSLASPCSTPPQAASTWPWSE